MDIGKRNPAMKKHFEIWYKKWLENLNEEVPDQVWEDIQDDLDLQEVWGRLTDHYDIARGNSNAKIKQFLFFCLCSLLLLFMPFILNESIDNTLNFIPKESQTEWDFTGGETVVTPSTKKDREEIVFPAVDGQENSNLSLSKVDTDIIQDTESLNAKEISSAKKINRHELAITLPGKKHIASLKKELIDIKPEMFGYEEEFYPEIPLKFNQNITQWEGDDTKEVKPKNFQIAYTGLLTGIKNTWLLNYETFNGLKRSTLSATVPTYRKESGFLVAIKLKEKHTVATELFWQSESGQKYMDYRNASYAQRDIRLSYLKAQMYYLLPNSYLRGDLIAGGYIAYLNQGQEVMEQTRMDVSGDYASFDYGLVTGYQVNVPLGRRLAFIPSVRLNYNLTNIFSGNDNLPAEYKKTRNAAVSLNAALVYRYGKWLEK